MSNFADTARIVKSGERTGKLWNGSSIMCTQKVWCCKTGTALRL